ncbi:LrgB family protein [Rhizobiales bacterium TNE-4]|nr:LrgB family protein [Rhizobiales bacterium TNE-4]MBV1827282.1 LrgB family protein [Rhizobiales bacterium TNE-4]
MKPISELWVYLAAEPLLWLTTTLIAYVIADRISAFFNRAPLANPVLIAVAIVLVLLKLTGTAYPVYFTGAQFVHFLLGPATVALALPLYTHRKIVMRALIPIAGALLAGAITAMVSAVGIAKLLGVSGASLIALAPKSVTAAIAMGIARELGGDPSLTATLVIATGIIGAVLLTPLMKMVGVSDPRAIGFAAGTASHGIGTARAFQLGSLEGAFAGIALGLSGLLTAVLVPLLVRMLSF